MKKDREKVYYYNSFEDDPVESADQGHTLPPDYVWVRTDFWGKAGRKILYFLSCIFSRIYGALIMHMKIVRNVDLRKYRDTGIIVYCNHTQPVGDAFNPLAVCSPKHCYMVASPANLGIPVLGPLLPVMGALPIPSSMREMKKFMDAIKCRLDEKNCIIIYPEGHVWPYYTKIRPFPSTSFSYPVRMHVPAFCMTTTYQKRRHGRPKTTIYLDGPFYPDESLSSREQKNMLHDRIFSCMQERSSHSTYQYIQYIPRENATDK